MGKRIRCQMIWAVQSATLRSTQVAMSQFTSAKIVALSGPDAEMVSWTIPLFCYTAVLPVEAAVLIALACFEVGVPAAFAALAPVVVGVLLIVVLVRRATTHKSAAASITAERLRVLDEALTSNPAVKLYDTSEVLLDKMKELRSQEERHLRWGAMSYAISLWLQIFLAPLMAWIASTSFSYIPCVYLCVFKCIPCGLGPDIVALVLPLLLQRWCSTISPACSAPRRLSL